MLGLAIWFGILVGFALGLTGGGGGVFAVPLLVYGLAVAPREAVGIPLASVGGTALFGVAPRLIRGGSGSANGVAVRDLGNDRSTDRILPFHASSRKRPAVSIRCIDVDLGTADVGENPGSAFANRRLQHGIAGRSRPQCVSKGRRWQASIEFTVRSFADRDRVGDRCFVRHVWCRRRFCDCSGFGAV